MGVAAYNRGSAAIRASLDAEARPVEFEIMDRLNALPKLPDAGLPFGPTRIEEGNGGFWHVCASGSGFGFWYATIAELMSRNEVSITGRDGLAWTCEPNAVERHPLLRRRAV